MQYCKCELQPGSLSVVQHCLHDYYGQFLVDSYLQYFGDTVVW